MVAQYGLSSDDAALKKILDNASLASIEVDDELSSKLTTPLLSMYAAKNNPELQRHFTAIALNGADDAMSKLVDEYGLTDDHKSAFAAEKNTYKRIGLLTKAIKELEEKKSGANKGDKTALEKEIGELRDKLKTLTDSSTAEKQNLLTEFENERLGWKQDSVYSKLLPQMAADKDPEVNMIAARHYVSKELQKNGWKVVTKDGNLAVVNAETGTDAYDKGNTKVAFDDLVSKTLANNKLLIPNKPNPQQPPKQIVQRSGNEIAGNGIDGSKFLAATDN